MLPHSYEEDSRSPLPPTTSRGSRVSGHGPGHKESIDNRSIINFPGIPHNRLRPSASIAPLLPIAMNSNSPMPVSANQSGTPERGVPSRAETSSSASTQTTSHPAPTVISPALDSAPTARRLTPSSIPFFGRSLLSSIQASIVGITSPSPPPAIPHYIESVFIPTSASKSTSKAKEKEDHREKEKDEKDRSESRISILMNRKREKVRSSSVIFSWGRRGCRLRRLRNQSLLNNCLCLQC